MRDALVRAAAGDGDAASHDLGTATGEPMVSSRAGRTQPLPLVRLRRVSRRAKLTVALVSILLGAALAAGALSVLDRPRSVVDAPARTQLPAPPTELTAEVPDGLEDAPTPQLAPDAVPAEVAKVAPPSTPPAATPRRAPKRGVAAGLPLKER